MDNYTFLDYNSQAIDSPWIIYEGGEARNIDAPHGVDYMLCKYEDEYGDVCELYAETDPFTLADYAKNYNDLDTLIKEHPEFDGISHDYLLKEIKKQAAEAGLPLELFPDHIN